MGKEDAVEVAKAVDELILRQVVQFRTGRIHRRILRIPGSPRPGVLQSAREVGTVVGKQHIGDTAASTAGQPGRNKGIRSFQSRLDETESPRRSRRLHLLRGWCHGKTEEVFAGDS